MPGFNIQGSDSCGGGPGGAASRADPNIEVARQHRYGLTVLTGASDEMLLYASKCDRPSPEADKVLIHHGQDEISVPGKSRWAPIEITFYEVVRDVDMVAKYLWEWHQKSMIDVYGSVQGNPTDYKKNCVLNMQDGGGAPIWTYRLYQVWPTKISPTTLAYSDTELSEITCTLEISKAVEGTS